MDKKEFYKKYCEICGTQPCGGVDDNNFNIGCTYYQKEMFGKTKTSPSDLTNHISNNNIIEESVKKVKHLIYHTSNGVIRDADTVLADILDDLDVEVSGVAYELLCIWENSKDRKSVERIFETLTGVSFIKFLNDSIDAMTTKETEN